MLLLKLLTSLPYTQHTIHLVLLDLSMHHITSLTVSCSHPAFTVNSDTSKPQQQTYTISIQFTTMAVDVEAQLPRLSAETQAANADHQVRL